MNCLTPERCRAILRTGAAADALDAGKQLRLPCPAAAPVVAHLVDDVADQHGALRGVHLVHHALLPAPRTRDAQEPRRERIERLIERRQWRTGIGRAVIGLARDPAVAAPPAGP